MRLFDNHTNPNPITSFIFYQLKRTMKTRTENVNLLDCNKEPSDAALKSLMQAVLMDAKKRAKVANEALFATLAHEVSLAREKYALHEK